MVRTVTKSHWKEQYENKTMRIREIIGRRSTYQVKPASTSPKWRILPIHFYFSALKSLYGFPWWLRW